MSPPAEGSDAAVPGLETGPADADGITFRQHAHARELAAAATTSAAQPASSALTQRMAAMGALPTARLSSPLRSQVSGAYTDA